ncbi:hypothetical protein HYH02_003673 [Chlamydomonas schloesseri]|uniref:Uncharacterized protein n=1 Tax=Chlamydomonas schloesseri TaxID=2026947 RepID=A0A836B9V2_9CHLO|nr:hypothetical protein HYH02_003673 [Chlamydomonas schloesseri]|eukprot:KAG2451898.1 hypothetical protein HYH02_003673 [Chlamydomonas schloesseri]
MSLSDSSDDDLEPGSAAKKVLQRLRSSPKPQAPFSLLNSAQRSFVNADPESLESQLIGAGVISAFNTHALEEALRAQAFAAVDKREHEIEAYEQALQSALAELRRVRGVEEARLAGRVEDATRRFEQQLAGLQQQYLAEVEKLKRQTVSELHKQRAASEAAIAARVRTLQGQLRHERPTSSLMNPDVGTGGGGGPQSPRLITGEYGSPSGRPSPGMRMRSARPATLGSSLSSPVAARGGNALGAGGGGVAFGGAGLSPKSPSTARMW